jgi:hypothetical protein
MRQEMMRLLALTFALAITACEGPVGPQGPAGPTGPQGPAGQGVSYEVFEGTITAVEMSTDAVNTGGVSPGIVCYISNDGTTWITLDTNSDGFACGIVQESSTSYSGRAVVPASFVNSGWIVRVVLFWLP